MDGERVERGARRRGGRLGHARRQPGRGAQLGGEAVGRPEPRHELVARLLRHLGDVGLDVGQQGVALDLRQVGQRRADLLEVAARVRRERLGRAHGATSAWGASSAPIAPAKAIPRRRPLREHGGAVLRDPVVLAVRPLVGGHDVRRERAGGVEAPQRAVDGGVADLVQAGGAQAADHAAPPRSGRRRPMSRPARPRSADAPAIASPRRCGPTGPAATTARRPGCCGRAAAPRWPPPSPARREVRVAGSGHSFTGAALTGDTLLLLDRLDRVLDVDRASGLVRVEAGITLAALCRALDARGLALPEPRRHRRPDARRRPGHRHARDRPAPPEPVRAGRGDGARAGGRGGADAHATPTATCCARRASGSARSASWSP